MSGVLVGGNLDLPLLELPLVGPLVGICLRNLCILAVYAEGV